ncbi:MAG: hypothetical protein ACOVRN_06680, partial [Flavobacterium sp.]
MSSGKKNPKIKRKSRDLVEDVSLGEVGKKTKITDEEASPVEVKNLSKDYPVQQMYAATDIPYLTDLTVEAITEYGNACHKYSQMSKQHADRGLIPRRFSKQIDMLWTICNPSGEEWMNNDAVSDERLVQFLLKTFALQQNDSAGNPLENLLQEIMKKKVVVDVTDVTAATARYGLFEELYRVYREKELADNANSDLTRTVSNEKLIVKELTNNLTIKRTSKIQGGALNSLKYKLEQGAKP